jgi:hypothetical protein
MPLPRYGVILRNAFRSNTVRTFPRSPRIGPFPPSGAGGQSTTGGSFDRRNTVEQVLLKTPPSGTYAVAVRSFTVPSGPQPFAVVATGDFDADEPPPPPPTGTVFFDDFESDLGWTVNPSGTDTATAGLWERGNPETTTSSGTKQQGTTVSGVNRPDDPHPDRGGGRVGRESGRGRRGQRPDRGAVDRSGPLSPAWTPHSAVESRRGRGRG